MPRYTSPSGERSNLPCAARRGTRLFSRPWSAGRITALTSASTSSTHKRRKSGHAGGPSSGRFCCKSRFALVIKNSAGCRRGFRVRMRGTSSPHVKLLFLMPGEHSTFTAVRALWPMGPASSSATAAICCSMKRPVGPSILRQVAGGRTVVSSALRRDPHDADSVADHVGGALLAFGAL